ncbi:MAG: hypothetical protein DDG60_05155 [Anaerolineae bacterium]|nr:MAG: hypothetical protein DDG60_05155 [Anaerolineae bacterium]
MVIGAVQAEHADLNSALVGGVRSQSVAVNGKTALMLANTIHAPQTNAILVAGAHIEAENVRAGLLIGRHVNGNVHTLLDTRGAILVGAITGLLAGLILLAGKWLFGHKNS